MKKFCMLFILIFTSYGWCQFLDSKEITLPPYEPKSGMSSKVREFIKSSITENNQTKKVARDLLGRASTDSMNYKNSIESKMKVIVSYVNTENSYVSSFSGRYEVDRFGEKMYWMNEKIISEKDYFNEYESKVQQQKKEVKKSRQSEIMFLTAKEIEKLMNGVDIVYISEYIEPKNNVTDVVVNGTTFYSDYDIRSISQIQNVAFPYGYKGGGIGIYFIETGCPHPNYVNPALYNQGNPCVRGVQTHPTGVVRVLQTTAPEAMVYGFDQGNHPDNPLSYSTPIYIGSHSWAVGSDSLYSATDYLMDMYVYDEKVIEFVAAGNSNSLPKYVNTPGKAVNALTVGALKPDTYHYEAYSCWQNSIVGNQKPEVVNFTNFFFPSDAPFNVIVGGVVQYYNGTFNGTSAATPYAAAMAADVLSQHSFFKSHPEMFKALMMTGSTQDIPNSYYGGDKDNYTRIRKFPLYTKMGWGTRSRYWNGCNSCFFDSASTISFIESDIVSGGNYRIAISWLSDGYFVLQNKILPQDIDLYVYQSGALIASSNSSTNPFEIVDFTTENSGDLTIVINRFRNSSLDNVILGYNLLRVN